MSCSLDAHCRRDPQLSLLRRPSRPHESGEHDHRAAAVPAWHCPRRAIGQLLDRYRHHAPEHRRVAGQDRARPAGPSPRDHHPARSRRPLRGSGPRSLPSADCRGQPADPGRPVKALKAKINPCREPQDIPGRSGSNADPAEPDPAGLHRPTSGMPSARAPCATSSSFLWWRIVRWLKTRHRWRWTAVRRHLTDHTGRWSRSAPTGSRCSTSKT
jgi:hypothetical protein